MRPLLPVAVAALAFTFAAAGLRARADDEEKCPLDKLPAKVTAAVKAKWPKGEMVEASKETEDKKTVYEVKVKDGDTTLEALLTEDGTITEIEKKIAVKDLPKKVADALAAKYPKGAVDRAEEITEGEKTSYEVIVTTAEKKRFEVKLDPDGKVLEEEEKSKEEDEKGGDNDKGMADDHGGMGEDHGGMGEDHGGMGEDHHGGMGGDDKR